LPCLKKFQKYLIHRPFGYVKAGIVLGVVNHFLASIDGIPSQHSAQGNDQNKSQIAGNFLVDTEINVEVEFEFRHRHFLFY
jgi:hypothetical protein